ncbi:MAG: hypothetical protein PHT33_01465 [bacterium]|nr:hypothetical protein [bacterium]
MPPWKEKWAHVLIVYGVAVYLVITSNSMIGCIVLVAAIWTATQFNCLMLGEYLAKMREIIVAGISGLIALSCTALLLNGYLPSILAIPVMPVALFISAVATLRIEHDLTEPMERNFMAAFILTCCSILFLLAVAKWPAIVVIRVGIAHAFILIIAVIRNSRLTIQQISWPCKECNAGDTGCICTENSSRTVYASSFHGLKGFKALGHAFKLPSGLIGSFLVLIEIVYSLSK